MLQVFQQILRNKVLSTILVVQLLAISGIYLYQQSINAKQYTNKALIDFPNNVDAIKIQDNDHSMLIARSESGAWNLPNYYGLSVGSLKVSQVLEQLLKMQLGWNIAQGKANFARFKLQDSNFERKIDLLSNGKTVSSILLGEASRYKKSYARVENSDQIFEANLTSMDLPLSGAAWVDPAMLYLHQSEICVVSGKNLTLERVKEEDQEYKSSWKISNANSGSDSNIEIGADADKISQFMVSLSHLAFSDILAADPQQMASYTTVDSYIIKMQDDIILNLVIYEIPQDQDHYLLSLSKYSDLLFKINRIAVEGLINLEPKYFAITVTDSVVDATVTSPK